MTSPSAIPSLRTELLVRLALLTAAAILLAVAGLVLLGDVVSSDHGTLYVGALLTADLVLVVALGAYVVQRLVVRPLTQLLSAAEAMAGGDSARRVGDTSSLEMHRLATSFNRITERRTEEQAQLVRAEKLASVGRLAAGVAHELGNPLTAITSYVHVLRGRLATSMERDIGDVLTVMERECARIDRIIRGLLDYARPRPSTATAVDVNDIVRSVVDLLAQQRALEGVQVDLELTRQELHIHGDRHDLEQLFVNLLLNAVDAMARSGRIVVRVERAARITLRQPSVRRSVIGSHPVEHAPSSRAQHWLSGHDSAEIAKIVVADSGPGVPPEIADRIFDPFFTTKQPGKGTGLGLAIVARIVDNCHGTIWVTTAREGGAAFHVLFPIAAAAVGESKAGPTPAARDERARRAG